jgi:hypothetical protein
MEIAKVKEFMYYDYKSKLIYKSKWLDRILFISEGSLISVYAILETELGEMLFTTDWSYSEEPIIMDVFMHKDSWLKFNSYRDIINLDIDESNK